MATIGALATFRDRIGIVEDTVHSLSGQLDLLMIYCNDEESFRNARKITTGNVKKFMGPNITDRGKFHFCKELRGTGHTYFTMDDDLIYPSNYVATTLMKLSRHECIVSYHGKKLISQPDHYYARLTSEQSRKDYRVLDIVPMDVEVDVIGAGCMAFSLDYFCPDDLRQDMMTDIEVSCLAQQQGKKRVVLAHPPDWVRYNPKMSGKWTIWDHYQQHSDSVQTRLINETFFKP